MNGAGEVVRVVVQHRRTGRDRWEGKGKGSTGVWQLKDGSGVFEELLVFFLGGENPIVSSIDDDYY